MAHRTVVHTMTLKRPSGEYVEIEVEREIRVTVLPVSTLAVEVSGFGINEARFHSLKNAYDAFSGGLFTPIRLDYDGNRYVIACIEELMAEGKR